VPAARRTARAGGALELLPIAPRMDPVTHALLGAAAGYAVAGRRIGRPALAIGAVAALLPDVDVLIRSQADPLLLIEHHRGFTHSLAFVPVGAAVASLPWLAARGLRQAWAAVLGAALVGYLSHALLDASTTYGTQLFWPFSSFRVGLDVISIIDPAITILLLVGVLGVLARNRPRPAFAALALALAYVALGAVQRDRALGVQERIAAERGHERTRGAVFPTFANNIVWRSLYQVGDSIYADRVRVPWLAGASWSGGPALERLARDEVGRSASADPRFERDFRRFYWFSDGWVARAPADPEVIGDARYSMRTEAFEPVWGIRFLDHAEVPTEWVNRSRERRLGVGGLWQEVAGRAPGYRPVSAAP
jgi:inner membrane protein